MVIYIDIGSIHKLIIASMDSSVPDVAANQ